jgi:putative ABC transport system ATP-binding protein
MALVEVQQVTKEYSKGDQKITPLRDATLSVERGEFLSLMGASGSGKSTLSPIGVRKTSVTFFRCII